ncbi:small acid-soluble spore protein Tlp [Brevibacillus ruminantium]|uniref:Small acid-soluble spore protein Tlp n=1 Tax=Brevibacillus ruminantium TaxID=2950604 RepID=A0ABY4WLZ3_9BACL|nr:small acid-soluble spore protein Tlp [Brevibacillus ruminantium]USG68188.1 small acid-soluble spore protein Tlp [Brevibacillus ruminantium]
MAKPDNRSDNVEKLQEMIENSIENIRETRDYLNAHDDEISAEEKTTLEQKNQRREESIEGFRSEIKDEATHME